MYTGKIVSVYTALDFVEVHDKNWKMPLHVLMSRMELPGKRKRFMDAVRVVELMEEDQMVMKNPQWRPLMGEAKRRSNSKVLSKTSIFIIVYTNVQPRHS